MTPRQDPAIYFEVPLPKQVEWRRSTYRPSLRVLIFCLPIVGALPAAGGGGVIQGAIALTVGSTAKANDAEAINDLALRLLSQDRLDEAEIAFRQVLSRTSENAAALTGLSATLRRAGQRQEARPPALSTDDTQSRGGPARSPCDDTSADDTATAAPSTLPCSASVVKPVSPWSTLELARTLVNRGQILEARKIMAASVTGVADDDRLRAAIIFADETDDPSVAAGLISKLHAQSQGGAATITSNPSPVGTSSPLRNLPTAPTAVSASAPWAQDVFADDRAELDHAKRLQLLKDVTIAPTKPNPSTVTRVTPRPASLKSTAASTDPKRATELRAGDPSAAPGRGGTIASPPAESPNLIFFVNSEPQLVDDQQAIQSVPVGSPDLPISTVTNPFRHNTDTSPRVADSTLTINPADPMLTSIDHEMAELRDRTAPTLRGEVDLRNHSGDPGLSHLDAYSAPLQTTFSPSGIGRITLGATPTRLNGGSLSDGNVLNNARFGSDALSLHSTANSVSYSGATPGNQQASGVGINLGYELNNLKTDVGSTPLGFRTTSVVGGVEWAPQITDHVRLRLVGERRAIDETLLSYAGASDPRSGRIWGGVTRTGGHVQLEANIGKMDMYVAAGGAALGGTHVQSNTMLSVQTGAFLPVWGTFDRGLRTGLNLSYLQYANNVSNFTLGQGGYFSPQSYISAIVPLIYHDKIDTKFSYELSVGLGVQNYREKASDYYPIDPQLQAALTSRIAGIPGLSATYPATKLTGFAGSAGASLDYSLTPSFQISAQLKYQHVGTYEEAIGMLVGKYLFNGIGP
jgi:hypothetical protein